MIVPGPSKPRSLLVEVLDWMLVPLAVLWPVAIAASYAIAMTIADRPYDRDLRERVLAVADELTHQQAAAAGTSLASLDRVRADPTDRIFAHVVGPDGLVAGDALLPAPSADACVEGEVRLRNAITEEGEVRIACQLVRRTGSGARVAIQVAEPLDRRQEHAKQVTVMVMGVVMILVPMTVLLVGLGLWRGLAPIRALRASIEAREATDLSPLPLGEAPEEIAPLVRTLNTQLERVRASLSAQRRFVADAAHQLRTPLAGLKTQAQVGRQAKSLEESHERLARIGESADHLSRLANQLLALARADDARVGTEPVDLGAALRRACHDLADAAIAKSIRLGLDAPEQGPRVAGDPGLLHELFVNLLDNAIRYTPEGGEVEVRITAGPGPVVEIEDSGPGVPEAECQLVFERFYRVLGTGIAGSGLGLPIVKSIAERHGASVELARGREGGGALFRVVFRRPPDSRIG